MDRAGIWHNADREFCFAQDRDEFVIRIYTKAQDMDKVMLCFQDKYIPLTERDTRQETEMKKVACDGVRDYYEARISIHMLCMRYYFALTDATGETLYYGNYYFYDERPVDIYSMFDCPQDSREEELFEIPKWAAGKVVYQIFVDRFAGDDYIPEALWYKQTLTYRDRLQGNLRGITQKLSYLEELGAEVLYLTPIFKAGASHKYDTIDYMEIDPDFGSSEDLCRLVEAAHEKGMYVMLDGVFNHTSTKFFAFQDLLSRQEASAYRDWYYPESFPVMEKGLPNYKTFGYYGGMPKLNCRNTGVQEYILKVAVHWMTKCGIDGWRLDVGDEIGHDFWRTFRKRVREVNPQALIVGEIWHYAADFLQGNEWDSVMNYRFYQAALGFAAKGSLKASAFAGELDMLRGRLHTKVYPVLWNLIGSHDTPRFLHEAGERKEALYLACAIQLLSPGMPMIYYGDEAGMTGGKDPDCRRGMLWQEEKRDAALFEWYRRLTALRKKYPAVALGERTWLRVEDESKFLIYRMELPERESVTVLLNGGEKAVLVSGYAGNKDLLTEERFDGKLLPFGVKVFCEEMVNR